jgi:hypothetical protein
MLGQKYDRRDADAAAEEEGARPLRMGREALADGTEDGERASPARARLKACRPAPSIL